MGQSASNTQRPCRPCGEWGGKNYNTVSVDGKALKKDLDKENAPPQGNCNKGCCNSATNEELEKQRIREEEEKRQAEARRQEQQRLQMERRVREEQERQQAEQRRLESERRREQALREQQEREEQARREQEQERLRKEADLRRQEEEHLATKLADEERRKAENQKQVQAWLQANGFKNENELVRKRMSKVRPLHVAVQQKDVGMLGLLVKFGADLTLTSGKGETALQLAQHLDKKGSHAQVIQALSQQA